MSAKDKPFTCTVKSCDMTFTNKNHLDWHWKKHEMMLNLELTNKNNESADQTPTPTRFIRNCEEVGLFQDLQHVNPFDETFKKAVDSAKNGNSLEVLEANNSNDTLHTPHILPHIEENQKKNVKQVTSDSHSFDFTTNDVQPIIVSDHPSRNVADTIKNQIIENIKKNKVKSKKGMNSFISCVPFEDLTVKKNKYIINLDSEGENESDSNEKKKQIREMNRASQMRCRKRKQLLWKQMEDEICNLKEENKKLKVENSNLKKQLMQFLEKNGTTKESAVTVMTDNLKTQENASQKTQKKKLIAPMMIPLIPSGTSLSIPTFMPNQPISVESCHTSLDNDCITKGQANRKRKTFRNIVPKILIKK
ncbi:unnamed protein product [Phaedon cochleariae]|uniref:Cyclic AMP-dependent transcription factor ATF-7 n=1 Tax=Phaedon cochleariae TaxID=80249 RepID=A0A9P0GR19_PHACE|nr:unnamed protein product [Phaedon cochleariae]